ncbi:MAG: hypothetical protein M3N82_12500 [Pseudomonadota bacterium]|nr:hypothetical protein [Pseudomonadota bacterium]
MDAAVAALLGTALGAVGSIGGVWLQQRYQGRRERAKVAADLGLADYTWRRKRIQENGGEMYPLSIFIAYHLEVLEALEAGDFNAKRIAEITDRQSARRDAIKGATDAARAGRRAGPSGA